MCICGEWQIIPAIPREEHYNIIRRIASDYARRIYIPISEFKGQLHLLTVVMTQPGIHPYTTGAGRYIPQSKSHNVFQLLWTTQNLVLVNFN